MIPDTPFYSGDALSVIDNLPVKKEPQCVVVQKTFIDYLPLVLFAISIALTLYMISQQNKRRRA